MFNPFRSKDKGRTLFFETDMHCHVLPGVDDGAPDLAHSMELIEALSRWGVRRVVATPHVTEDTFPNSPDTIAEPLATLRQEISGRGMDIELTSAAEYRISDFAVNEITGGRAMTMGNNCLLVENPFVQEPWNLDQTLFDLKVKGFNLIFAHPERYIYYHQHPERYRALHNNGMYFQINLLSLAGYYGKEMKKQAEWLAEQGLVEYVGTDVHRRAHVDAIDAYLGSRDYRRHAAMLADNLLNDRL